MINLFILFLLIAYIFIFFNLAFLSLSYLWFLFFNFLYISLFIAMAWLLYFLNLNNKSKPQKNKTNSKKKKKEKKLVLKTKKIISFYNNGNRKNKNLGDRLADKITAILGSWSFIVVQTIILLLWMGLNLFAWVKHWDPYPFILLNLALSFQAAYSAPIIMMSQNRMTEHDRKRLEIDLAITRKNDRAISKIQSQLNRIERNIRTMKNNNNNNKIN